MAVLRRRFRSPDLVPQAADAVEGSQASPGGEAAQDALIFSTELQLLAVAEEHPPTAALCYPDPGLCPAAA